MTAEPPPTTQFQASRLPWILVAIALVIAIYFGAQSYFRGSSGQQEDESRKNSPEEAMRNLEEVAASNSKLVAEQQQTRAQSVWKQTESKVDLAIQDCKRTLELANTRDQRLTDWLTSSEGRRIGQDEKLVAAWAAMQGDLPHATRAVRDTDAQLQQYQGLVKKALAEKALAILPEPDVERDVEKAHTQLRTLAQTLEQQVAALDALLLAAPKSVSKESPTLKEAIEAWKAARAEAVFVERAQELARIEAEEAAKTRAADAENARQIAEAQRAKEAAEVALAKEKLQSDTKALDGSLAREKTRQALAVKHAEEDKALDAVMDEVQTLLSPFISKGKTQPNVIAKMLPADEEEPQPVSFGKIKSSGALTNQQQGHIILFHIAHRPYGNDRPQGSFPVDPVGGLAQIKRAQKLLLEHGPAMVRRGLLLE